MAEKLSWTELRRLLASRADVSEKDAGAFLNALTAQLIEGLKTDKQVKINGLGSFKLQAVAPRKSVDVNTGEEITIEGYNKVVFTSEAGVKEMVEKQFAAGGAGADNENDPLRKLGEQANEIVDLLADLGQKPNGESEPETVVEEPAPLPLVDEPIIEEPIISEPTMEEQPIMQEPMVETPVVEEPAAEESSSLPFFMTQQPEDRPEEKPEKEKSHFFRNLLIILLILLLLAGGGYYFFRDQLCMWIGSLELPFLPKTEQAAPVQEEPVAEELFAEEQPAEEVMAEEAVAEEPAAPEQSTRPVDLIPKGRIPKQQILEEFLAASDEIVLDDPNLITTEAMHEGSRLTWMSKRFYGDKRFWPYIYDANRDVITNPNNIETGTPIRVPRLTAQQLDTNNAASRAELERLRIEAEEACKR